ncbi:MAG TPA: hypothetical protein VFA89_20630 [Terriglobales bacterium]|nr:hypothetical protein [Terriglobales bacterium]
MSDGPHKSLDMRRGWKRVAECGDNLAFTAEEIGRAMILALEQDCNSEIAPAFLNSIRNVFEDQESSLFKSQLTPKLEALRDVAGPGMGRLILEHAIQLNASGENRLDDLVKATQNGLTDRGARGARQVEEHYLRKSTAPRAQKVRTRIEEGIGQAETNTLARRLLKLEPRESSSRTVRQKGLDDGVKIR